MKLFLPSQSPALWVNVAPRHTVGVQLTLKLSHSLLLLLEAPPFPWMMPEMCGGAEL